MNAEDREAIRERAVSLVIKRGKTYAETAECLGISPGAVAGIIHRHRNPDAEKKRREKLIDRRRAELISAMLFG